MGRNIQMKTIIVQRKFRITSIILITLMIMISALPYSPLSSLYPKMRIQSNLMPILWGIICIFMWFLIPKTHPIGKIKRQDSLLFDVIICVTLLIGFRLLAGLLIDEIGKSPYVSNLQGAINNLILFGPVIVAKELIRAYCLSTYCRKDSNKAFYIITMIVTISNISIESLTPVNGTEGLMTYFAEFLGPQISMNILLSYFALYGGPLASFLYIGIATGFTRFFPIIPSLQWITEGVVSMSVPILETFYISNKYEQHGQHRRIPKESIASLTGWTAMLATSVAFIWFVVGTFPIYPSVIVTGSMRPLICEGDVILIEKAMEEQDIVRLKEGDIIQFTRDDILITHRIIEVVKDKADNLSFRTKGDNNFSEDTRLVLPNEVRGTLIKVIPKLGIPTFWIKTRVQKQPEGVEN